MATEKIINTRIQLKYDSYENWSKSTVTLKSGEIAIAYLGPAHTTTTPDNGSHPVLFKVGPGKFNDLPWASALAADVYEWAKKNEVKIVTNNDGNAVTGVEIKDGYLTFSKDTKFATKAELDAAIEAFGGDLSSITDNDHVYTYTYDANAGTLSVVETNYVNGKAGESKTVLTADFVSHKELNEILANYYTKEDVNNIVAGYKPLQDVINAVETAANTFVDTVAQDTNGKITITTKAVDFSAADDRFKKLQTAIAAVATEKNVFVEQIAQDEQGVITIITKAVDFSAYRTADDQDAIDANFKIKQNVYNAEGSNTKTVTKVTQNANGEVEVTYDDIAFPAQTDYTVSCEDEDIQASGDTPAFKRHTLKQLDGTVCVIDVPKDMVIADGRVEGDKLILVLNTGKEIEVEVGNLIEYVTGGTAADGVITVTVDPTTYVATATINDGTITSAKFTEEVDTYVDNRVDTKINALDVNDITGFGAGKTLATLTETDGKIAATFQDIAITESQITDLKDYKEKQTAISAANTDTNVFAYGVDQNENGEIEVKTKSVDFTAVNDAIDTKLNANGWVDNSTGWQYTVDESNESNWGKYASFTNEALRFGLNFGTRVNIDGVGISGEDKGASLGADGLKAFDNPVEITHTHYAHGRITQYDEYSDKTLEFILPSESGTLLTDNSKISADQFKATAASAGAETEEVWVFNCGSSTFLVD